MRARTVRLVIANVVALGVLLGAVAPAQADHHEMKIRAIFKAGAASDFAFVELQMTAPGQTNVSGTAIRIYNAAGNIFTDFPLDNDVSNGASQRMVLVGESNVMPTPDSVENFQTNLDANAGGGAACYMGLGLVGIDCVSWGTFTGFGMLPSPASNPIGGGLSSTMVSVRNIGGGTCPTALDNGDDTNSSSTDFGFAVGYPIRNNSSAITETLCPPPVTPTTATPTPKKKKKCKKKKRKKGAGKSHADGAAKKKKGCKKRKKKK